MKNVKLLLLMSFLFLTVIGFSQNTVTYSTLSKTIDLNSGAEGTVDIVVNCYGSSSTPVFLNATQSCGNNDGILSTTYTNGSILAPGQNTTIRYKFKKTVTTNTQIAYKFSTNGSCFQSESEMIKITVNYKAGSTTTPPVIPSGLIYIGSWPTTNATINEGSVAPLMSGTGAGNYTHQWYKTINGVFTLIPGATNYYYNPGIPFVTTTYFRQNISGSAIGSSNQITINVINNAPPILNNTITINGANVYGSSPTGGISNYTYSWVVINEHGDSSNLSYTSPDVMFSAPEFTNYLKSPKICQLGRVVYSGSQRLISNFVEIPHISEIQNNTISINNNQVIGSIPTGGMGDYNGDYTYSWVIFNQDGDSSNLSYTSPNVMFSAPEFANYLKSPYICQLARVVYSGSQRLISNFVEIPNSSSSNLKTLKSENTLISTVYPNPTSGTINFTTNFSSNKEIEIIVYSEKLKNTQLVFKGTATPNQIVTWDIPSNYIKGIYFYKIVSGNEEIKSGKIIFQ